MPTVTPTLPAYGTDAGPALQAAIDSLNGQGVVELPAGTYTLATPVSVRHPNGGQCGVSLVCRGGAVALDYTGPADQPAVRIARDWYARVGGPGGLTVRRKLASGQEGRAANGTAEGTGVWVAPDAGSTAGFGTQAGGLIFENLSVIGFDVGLRLGWKDPAAGRAWATSENEFVLFVARGCNTGVKLEDYNTLDNVFRSPCFSSNQTGLRCEKGGGETHIDGGSASYCGADFKFASGGVFTVSRFRSEGVGTLTGTTPWSGPWGTGSSVVVAGGDYRVNCQVTGCAFTTRSRVTNQPLLIGTHNANVVVKGGFLTGSRAVWHSHHFLQNGAVYKNAGALTVEDVDFMYSTAADRNADGTWKPAIEFGANRKPDLSTYVGPNGERPRHRAHCTRNAMVVDNGADTLEVPDVVYTTAV